jgi:hypothetical protein
MTFFDQPFDSDDGLISFKSSTVRNPAEHNFVLCTGAIGNVLRVLWDCIAWSLKSNGKIL